MKVYFLLACFLLSGCFSAKTLTPTSTESIALSKIVGVWNGTDARGEKGGLVLNDDGTADLIKEGKSATAEHILGRGTMEYEYDSSTEPDRLDLIVNMDTGTSNRLQGTVEFISDNEIEVVMNGEKVTLQRQSKIELNVIDE